MEQTHEDAPLAAGRVSGSEEALILPGTGRRDSNKRAFKIAGLTTLACLLVASQVFTAYLVFDQKEQIQNLQKETEDSMRKLMTRKAQGAPVQMHVPMNSMSLLKDFTEDGASGAEKAKTPLTRLEDIAIVSVEKQVKDLLQNSQLPQFNETFQANLERLKQQVEEAEWKGFESWLRNWLIFQMAQEKPPAPPTTPPPQSASVLQSKCQLEAGPGGVRPGLYKPQCDDLGNYNPVQCWHSTGFCWCVDGHGTPIEGTTVRGRPDC